MLTFNWVAGLPPSRLPVAVAVVAAAVQLVITSPMFPPSLITPISISVLLSHPRSLTAPPGDDQPLTSHTTTK